mmetsp:Transcript_16254/g.16426  ORF Transcript_16254/g.16426 Transcript_16254/m.16426 type:complete len:127 (+) Transcript_16254:154-534(+)
MSIDVSNYMILRSPKLDDILPTTASNNTELTPIVKLSTRASRRAKRKAKKVKTYSKFWSLAHAALQTVDPKFANTCTEIAMTYQFRGSPAPISINRTVVCFMVYRWGIPTSTPGGSAWNAVRGLLP